MKSEKGENIGSLPNYLYVKEIYTIVKLFFKLNHI
jgi:hypothetical protein